LSDRLGAPTDMVLSVRNGTGKQVSEMVQLDDSQDTLSPTHLYTVNRDPPPYRFVAPADGTYYLLLTSHLGDILADPTHTYRGRISPERPDFRLVVMPADSYRPDSCVIGAGGNREYTVFAVRQDGFKGDIALSVEGLPEGVTCRPQWIGPNQKQIY